MKSCIIVANGDSPSKRLLLSLQKMGAKTIIAADGGANTVRKLGITPNFIIGDFDSISEDVKNYFSSKSELIYYKRQNDTDVEKSLKFAIRKGFKKVFLLAATGDRLDHTICNLGIVIKYFSKIRIVLIHGKTILFPYSTPQVLKTIPNETISIYAFDDKTFVTSIGLKYQLKESNLRFGVKESTSNVATGYEVKLEINGGIIFVVRELEVVRKNDFIFNA